MKFCDAPNFARRITRISLNDHFSHFGVLTTIHDETEFDPLMRGIDRRVHANGRRKVSVLSKYPLHALDPCSYQIFVKLLPDLQFAAVYQLVSRWGTRGSIYDHAADKQLLLDDKIQVERVIGIRRHLSCDRSESACSKQLLQTGVHAGAVKNLIRLQRNRLEQLALLNALRVLEADAPHAISGIARKSTSCLAGRRRGARLILGRTSLGARVLGCQARN